MLGSLFCVTRLSFEHEVGGDKLCLVCVC
jgi:hypothetical protein